MMELNRVSLFQFKKTLSCIDTTLLPRKQQFFLGHTCPLWTDVTLLYYNTLLKKSLYKEKSLCQYLEVFSLFMFLVHVLLQLR